MTRSPGAARATSVARAALAIATLAALLAACAPATSEEATPPADPTPAATAAAPTPTPDLSITYPLELTDDEGGAVVIERTPERLVSLTPAVTETLFALGVGDRIVGNDDYDDYPPEAAEIEPVATYAGVDVEKVVALEPDLVIAGGQGFTNPEAVAKLRSLGIQVLVVYAPDIAGVLADIRLIGLAVNRLDAAEAITQRMAAGIDAVIEAIGSRPTPRVFYEIDATQDIYGPADDSFLAEMIELAGGIPVTTGSPTVYSIPLETLVAADPEVIVLGDANYGVTVDQVAARPAWRSITAVKSGAIRPVNDTVVTRPGPRLVEGLRELALAIHGEIELPPAPVIPPLGE